MKKSKDAREPEKDFYYTGNVGSVRGQSGHEVDQYKEIAKAIMAEIKNKDTNNEKWPATVEVEVKRGGKKVDEPWTQRTDRKDFLHGNHF